MAAAKITHIAVLLALLFSIISTTRCRLIGVIHNDSDDIDNDSDDNDSDETTTIPADEGQVDSWFKSNVKPYTDRKDSLDPALVAAEANSKLLKVRKDGGGDFRTVSEALKRIPDHNTQRVVVLIGPGTYTEKIKIDRAKPFVTLYGDQKNMPTLIFGDTAAQKGTLDSASLTVEADYFNAVNLIIGNSAPRPDGKKKDAQAVALRISGDKTAFYNCKVLGFQDTLCDDKGKHFFKDCYIEGTVDFIFGNGKSLYLSTELHVIEGDGMAMITAQARHTDSEDAGYSFVHCKVTGAGKHAALSRAWMPYSKVIYAYTEMSDAVKPEGWSNNFHPENEKSVTYGEYKNKGPGSNAGGRAKFSKQLNDGDIKPYITLTFIDGSKWLLPPYKF
ncbi:pectinesterase 1-like [Cornus florida]|uniref:pectinesterase 1-like n=1 Tax=Cornus florida TaxID=4283 RepID=UPI0028A1AC78|nr:pectinesterase 1-like [Cornus florida]